MADEMTFFFDSCVLVDLFQGNIRYKEYENARAITTYLHVYEVYFILRKKYPEEEIMEFFERIKNFSIPSEFNWIPRAVKFRIENQHKGFSYADCLGYIAARELEIKFLTSDTQFKGFPNVEFVK